MKTFMPDKKNAKLIEGRSYKNVFNRPGVAGAVLHTASLLIN